MRAEVAKTFTFEAAHRLPNHDGKCREPHGHSYRVEVAVEGEIRPADGSPSEGMVIDFAVLDDIWERLLKPRLDHRNLNEVIVRPTTAENIAVVILETIRPHLDLPITVTVWETAKCRATVRSQ